MLAPAMVALGIALLPVLIPLGPGNIAPVDAVLLGASLCVALWAGTTSARLRFPYAVAVALFAFAGLLSALLGPLPIAGALAVVQDMFLFLWCLAVANVLRTPRGMKLILWVWCVSSTAWATALVLSVLMGQTAVAGVAESSGSRASLTFGEQNGAALYFAISLMIVLAARRPLRKATRSIAVAVLVVAIVLTGSLGGLAGLIVGLAVTTLLFAYSRYGLAIALLTLITMCVLTAGVAGFVQSHGLIERAHESPNQIIRDSIGRLQQSSTERQTLASETTGLYRTGTLLGVGPAATEYALRQNQSPYPKEAHNDFVAAVIERGILGALAIMALVGAVIVYASGTRSVAPRFRAILPAPMFLIGALTAVAVASLAHEVLHDRTVWTLLGLVAAVSLWAAPGRDRETKEATWPSS
jgi:O-antigen ligase